MNLKKLSPGFKQFLIKTGIFIGLFLLIQIVLILLQSTALPNEFYIIADVDIGKALLLTSIILFFLTKDKLNELAKYRIETKTIISSGIFSLVSFFGYFLLKDFIIKNPILAVENIALLFPLKELLLTLGTLLLIIAIFGIQFSDSFFKRFKKEIKISVGVFILTLFFIIQFQNLWVYFSHAVAQIVYSLLDLTFNATLTFTGSSPNLGITNFIVNIGKPCSGIDSMLMFIFLYVFIAGYDWKVFNKKKVFLMFIPGIISVFLLNIIRIYLLIVIGAFISRDFAVGIFHTNASMILFLAYFAIFWMIFYKWMKK